MEHSLQELPNAPYSMLCPVRAAHNASSRAPNPCTQLNDRLMSRCRSQIASNSQYAFTCVPLQFDNLCFTELFYKYTWWCSPPHKCKILPLCVGNSLRRIDEQVLMQHLHHHADGWRAQACWALKLIFWLTAIFSQINVAPSSMQVSTAYLHFYRLRLT